MEAMRIVCVCMWASSNVLAGKDCCLTHTHSSLPLLFISSNSVLRNVTHTHTHAERKKTVPSIFGMHLPSHYRPGLLIAPTARLPMLTFGRFFEAAFTSFLFRSAYGPLSAAQWSSGLFASRQKPFGTKAPNKKQ